MSSLLRRAAMRFGYEKVDILVKRRREGQFSSESEQGALLENYRAHILKFGYKIWR